MEQNQVKPEMEEKNKRGTVLVDDEPALGSDPRNLRHDNQAAWLNMLKEKKGLVLPDGPSKAMDQRKNLVRSEDEGVRLVNDPREERHVMVATRDPETRESVERAGSPEWNAHVEKVRRDRGYDKSREKPKAEVAMAVTEKGTSVPKKGTRGKKRSYKRGAAE